MIEKKLPLKALPAIFSKLNFTILTVFISPFAVHSRGSHSGIEGDDVKSRSAPQFDVYHRAENHTIQLGATAFLPCIIKNLGNRSVSMNPSYFFCSF